MKKVLDKIKEKISGLRDNYDYDAYSGDYIEVDADKSEQHASNVVIRPFVINDFADIKPVLDALREGSTIALMNIRPLRDRDIVELKRAVNKLKKTCDALEGDIAGFGEDWIIATPNFAYVHRDRQIEELEDSGEQQ
ncbi:cell division protein SepF [Candidatus Woesearchaeota archaeon]|nr:cell division protein SepF [Candidatus Woesearchaeota archaeon]